MSITWHFYSEFLITDDRSIGYTFDLMVDDFIAMILGGMETSANALSLLFMELARQPDMTAK